MTAKVFRASELEVTPIERQPSYLAEFDWQMGVDGGVWGMPIGMLTVLAAPAGMGKTRWLASLAKSLLGNEPDVRVLFNQSEMPAGNFTAKYLNGLGDLSDRLYVTPETELIQQLNVIRQVRPRLAIIDSAQQIDEFANGRGANEVVSAYREVLQEVGCHAIFVSQQNADGSAKGGTVFSHMVDTVIKGQPGRIWYTGSGLNRDTEHSEPIDGCFSLRIDDKHRYGRTPTESLWKHEDWGVSSGSRYRMNDKRYMANVPSTDTDLPKTRAEEAPQPAESQASQPAHRRWYHDMFNSTIDKKLKEKFG